MKWSHFGCVLLSLCGGVFLGQLSSINQPIKQWLMPPVEVNEIQLSGTLHDYFSNEPLLDDLVGKWYEQLSPTARVGQLIMPAWTENQDLTALIQTETIGGFMWLGAEIIMIDSPSSVPLFIASDAEPSLLKYRFNNPVFSGETAELDTPEKINNTGQAIAQFLKSQRINLNFAPVYDNDKNKSVISGRSFGHNIESIVPKANTLADTFTNQNIIPTAKHFPGHGNVTEDTHLELATITENLYEIPQFQAAIDHQVPVMMVGHLAVNTPEYDTVGLPATLSPTIMKTLLRDELGFTGITITDAMNMQAVSKIPNADLKALQAGTDVVLMPTNPAQLNKDIQALMLTDSLFAKSIEDKVKRVLRLKAVWALGEIF